MIIKNVWQIKNELSHSGFASGTNAKSDHLRIFCVI